ncbi:AI-2E family transporter [Paracoccus sp. CPCC 101403]|uniref:AI-2E family transporter n=1 Tax=Paracoccus broussonetiae TaxID=3075834 RepID=A0ABU3E8M9_9RHOB|nr:AI-2E family transporter [Paracoccus sp. CPCC 101403]MDT1060232.1 AI-2E family transporter [Paracoccus sp. CPCC 101403]
MTPPDPSTHMFPSLPRDAGKGTALPKVANWAIIGIFLILMFWFVAQARDFLMPVTLALLLFFVFVPFRRVMERWRIGPTVTAAIVSLGLVVSILGIGMMISGPVSRLIDNAPQIGTRLEQRFTEIRRNFAGLERAARKLDELTGGKKATDEQDTPPGSAPRPAEIVGPDVMGTVTGRVTSVPTPGTPQPPDQHIEVQVNAPTESTALGSVMDLGPAVIGQIILTLFLLFFMLASGDLLYLKIVQSFDRMRDKRAAYLALREIEDRLGAYLGAITLINACLGIAIGLAMWAWGMPSPVLFGLVGFLLNFIPYLGPVFGIIIAALVGVFVFDDLFTPLMVALTYLALTSFEGQLITPYFVSRKLQLNTVVVFLTVALWAWLWSVLGMIVAVPLLVVMRVLADHVPGLEKFGNFLAGEDPPALEDEDEEEARELVETGGDTEDMTEAARATRHLSP